MTRLALVARLLRPRICWTFAGMVAVGFVFICTQAIAYLFLYAMDSLPSALVWLRAFGLYD